ncbi:hypothetical protein MKC97_19200 [[Clostridium] innocuum]|nr:hypothetical protein [[Clostridium] innocuum]MCR0266457.1 hypothetical protein [[Clostridium] innocuum]
MRKLKTWGYMVLLFSICILGGCKDTEAETVQGKIVKAESSEQLLMVNGQLYYNTKKTDNESLRCGMMDGEIDSMVGRTEILKKDNQSNFATGISYQIGDQEIELAMDGSWVIFKPWKPVVPLDIEK